MQTLIHLSIDDGPERILKMGRQLSSDEKTRVKAAVCGFVRLLQVWMDGDRMRTRVGDDFTPAGTIPLPGGRSSKDGVPNAGLQAKQ